MAKLLVRITHSESGTVLAQGNLGWHFFSFEGNYYISRKYITPGIFKFSGIPGLCFYKFIYFWYHLDLGGGLKEKFIAWKYWIPNPIFPFIWFRLGIPKNHPALKVEFIGTKPAIRA